MKKRLAFVPFLIAALYLSAAIADEEAGNYPQVTAGETGRCYLKSVPKYINDPYISGEDDMRQQGQTNVYITGQPNDRLVTSFDWFSNRVFLRCSLKSNGKYGIAITRFGPWQRGHDPHDSHLAIAFYFDGQLMKRYSTLDIAGGEKADPPSFSAYKNVSASVSHYTVFEDVKGPIRGANGWEIIATTVDGRILTFEMGTGEIIGTSQSE